MDAFTYCHPSFVEITFETEKDTRHHNDNAAVLRSTSSTVIRCTTVIVGQEGTKHMAP